MTDLDALANTVREGRAFCMEIKRLEAEDIGWGYQWEHLGYASKDVHTLMRYVESLADGVDALVAEVERLQELVVAQDELTERAKQAEAGGCAFGCGPYPADGPHVGSGVGLVPACPTHGWVCALLDARDEALKAAEAEVERLTAALREIANDPVEALVVKRAREALAGKETTT